MKAYIELLIWTMLFVVVIEMIFPSSELKKYLKLILGFMVVYTILSPLLENEFISHKDYKDYVKYYAEKLTIDTSYKGEVENQTQTTTQLYKEQLEETIKNTLKEELPIEVLNAEVTLTPGNLEVEEVGLTVVRNKVPDKIFIPAIKIGDKTESFTLQDSKIEKEIKSCLKNFYNLKDANIHITVQEN